jgi:hypothetical protein
VKSIGRKSCGSMESTLRPSRLRTIRRCEVKVSRSRPVRFIFTTRASKNVTSSSRIQSVTTRPFAMSQRGSPTN